MGRILTGNGKHLELLHRAPYSNVTQPRTSTLSLHTQTRFSCVHRTAGCVFSQKGWIDGGGVQNILPSLVFIPPSSGRLDLLQNVCWFRLRLVSEESESLHWSHLCEWFRFRPLGALGSDNRNKRFENHLVGGVFIVRVRIWCEQHELVVFHGMDLSLEHFGPSSTSWASF